MPKNFIEIDGLEVACYRNPIDGRPVIDPLPGFENRILPLTQKHIKLGIPGTANKCAGVVAICDTLDAIEAYVQKGRTYIRYKSHPDVWMRYLTPQSLKFEALVGDRKGKQEESIHYLNAISKNARLGQQTGTDKVPGKETAKIPRKTNPRSELKNVRTSIIVR